MLLGSNEAPENEVGFKLSALTEVLRLALKLIGKWPLNLPAADVAADRSEPPKEDEKRLPDAAELPVLLGVMLALVGLAVLAGSTLPSCEKSLVLNAEKWPPIPEFASWGSSGIEAGSMLSVCDLCLGPGFNCCCFFCSKRELK